MSQTLLTVTNFPHFIKSARCISISSDDLNNSNFIINQYIQALYKVSNSVQATQQSTLTQANNSKIFGVFLNQSYLSYSFVQMKCGYNLKSLKERNQFRCLDVLSDLELFEEPIQSAGDCSNAEFKFKKFETVLIDQLMNFFNLDNESVDSNAQRNENAFRVLIIDDITSLLALNVQLNDLVNFINLLKHYCSFHQITLIIQTYSDSSRLDQLVKLDTYLNSISDLVLSTSKLQTGYSNKVDGNLEIRNYTNSSQQNYLFKSTERTARLYSPGTI